MSFVSLGKNSAFGKLSDRNLGKRYKITPVRYAYHPRIKPQDLTAVMPVKITPRGEKDFTSIRAEHRRFLRKKGILNKHLKIKGSKS